MMIHTEMGMIQNACHENLRAVIKNTMVINMANFMATLGTKNIITLNNISNT